MRPLRGILALPGDRAVELADPAGVGDRRVDRAGIRVEPLSK